MRVIRFTTDESIEAVEKEIINSLQFFFGWHLRDIMFEFDGKIERNKANIYLIKYIYNTPAGRKIGRIPQISLYNPRRGEYVILVPDEPPIVMALAHGLSKVATSLDVNIGNYNHSKKTITTTAKQVDANPVTVNRAINSAVMTLLVDKKINARIFTIPLSYGVYIVVYGIKNANEPLDTFEVELELIVDEDIVEIGIDAKRHSSLIKPPKEEYATIEEEFVYVGNPFEIEKRIERRKAR